MSAPRFWQAFLEADEAEATARLEELFAEFDEAQPTPGGF